MVGKLFTNDITVQELSARFGGTVATRAALAAVGLMNRVDGMLMAVGSDNSLWRFSSVLAQDATDDPSGALLVAPADDVGRWVRAEKSFVAKLAIGFGTADAAPLLTVPEGFCFRLASFPWWEVTTAFTGGTSAAIGISTSISGYTTKGDLLGGASGDVLATLVAGIANGTAGGELDDLVGFQAMLFEEGNEIRFDRITSVFEAGAGFACVPILVAAAPATP